MLRFVVIRVFVRSGITNRSIEQKQIGHDLG